MTVRNTSKSGQQSLRHPVKSAIQYAAEGRVKNVVKLHQHLAECPQCRDRVKFVQKLINVLRTVGVQEREREQNTRRSLHP
jgi:predicted anti-sigma-YlaC factor YlaD